MKPFSWARDPRALQATKNLFNQTKVADSQSICLMVHKWPEYNRPVFEFGRAALEYAQLLSPDAEMCELPFPIIGIQLPYSILLDIYTDADRGALQKMMIKHSDPDKNPELVNHFLLTRGISKRWAMLLPQPGGFFAPGLANSVIVDRLVSYIMMDRPHERPVRVSSQTRRERRKTKAKSHYATFRVLRSPFKEPLSFVEKALRLGQPITKRIASREHWVMGHWRNQPCGPGLSQRKRIFVQPFKKCKGQLKISDIQYKVQ